MIWKARGRLPQLMFLVSLIFIVARYQAYGQESDARSDPGNPQKKWQLKFSVGANFIPRQFDGFKVYIQRMVSGSKAVRFGIGLRDYGRGIERKSGNVYPTDDYYREINLDIDQLMFSTAIDLIAYIKSGTTIKPYLGIGPFFEYSLTGIDQKSWQNGNQASAQTYITDRKILNTGFTATMGAEWHLNHILLFQAEYSLGFIIETTSRSYTINNPNLVYEYTGEHTINIDYYRIDAGYIKTGLSVVF
ncbi:MAG: hypothetical protein JSU85_14470 [Candidatus Zixiibacteriota bacterium]|nr:MAG: hypothetical protein JSU85_14470 [candidate division Zixibacteria bacterium]